MGKTFPILVTTRHGGVSRYWWKLNQLGLHYTGNGRYEGKGNKAKFERIKAYSRGHGLKCIINNSYGVRSTDYRRTFFKHNPPSIFSGYFCSYCGRYVSRRKLSVDHLYPIGKAAISPALQRWLSFLQIDDINSARNLIPACKRCNQNKGAHMGVWILKGYLGRIQWLWYGRWTIRFVVLMVILMFLYRFLGS